MSETSFIKRFDITLDLKQPGCGGDFSVVDGDTGNVVYLALTDAGIPVSVEGRRIIAAFSNSRGKYMQDSAESGGGISVSDDKVKLQLRPQSFAPGIVECELQIYSGGTENSAAGATVYDSLVTTAKFNFSCRSAIYDASTIESEPAAPPLSAVLSAIGIAEGERVKSETARNSAEAERAAAEKSRAASEKGRILSEASRVNAENSRKTAEAGRARAETTRETTEAARKQNEALRISAENNRAAAETNRAKAEAKRSEAENNRIANENARKTAELERSAAETERAAAETERSRIFRGEVELPTASTPNDDPVDFAVESGWYFYKGGILVVSAALSGSAGSEYGTIEQAALLTDGTIIHRTCTVSAGAKNWSAWA